MHTFTQNIFSSLQILFGFSKLISAGFNLFGFGPNFRTRPNITRNQISNSNGYQVALMQISKGQLRYYWDWSFLDKVKSAATVAIP